MEENTSEKTNFSPLGHFLFGVGALSLLVPLSSPPHPPTQGSLGPFFNPVWMGFSPCSGGSLCHDNFWWPASRQDGRAPGSGPPKCTQVREVLGRAPSLPSGSPGVSDRRCPLGASSPLGSRWTSSAAAACTPGQISPSTSTLASTPPSRTSSATPCAVGAGKPRPGGPIWPCRKERASSSSFSLEMRR